MFEKVLFTLDKVQKKKVVIFFFFSLLVVFLELLSLGMIIPLVNSFLDTNSEPSFLKYLPQKIQEQKSLNLIVFMIIIFNFLILLKNIILYFVQKYQAVFISEFQQRLSIRLFKNYLNQPVFNLLKNNIATINRNVIDLSTEYTNLLLHPLIQIVSDSVMLIFILFFLIFAEPYLTIIGLLIVAFISLSIYFYNKKILSISGKEYKFYRAERIKSVLETFGAILEVKSFNKESLFLGKFEKFSKMLKDIQIRVSVIGFVPKLIFETITIILISIFFLILNKKIGNTDQIIATIVLFSFAIIKITPLMNKILQNSQRIKYSQAILSEIYFVLSSFSEKKENKDTSLEFKNHINLQNISYSYESNNELLKNINLHIKKNNFIAISGESGSGKSTLLKIILGLLKPNSGDVIIDNKSIYSNLSLWNEKVNFVPQDIFILDDTLKNNITLETDDKKIDYERLEQATNKSNLNKFLKMLPHGYDTILGDRGSRISGGQKQRIGIARALYSKSEVIIFDESTSSLDEESEFEIFKILAKLKKDKTIIFVTHKTNIKNFSDQIFKLTNNSLIKI